MTTLCTSFAFVLAVLQILGLIHVPVLVYALLLLPLVVWGVLAILSLVIMLIALVAAAADRD